MKREAAASPTKPAKRLRLNHEIVDLVESKSLREQAEPYRLATAKFRIDALTSTWSLGSNRKIHDRHVQSLCRIFEEQGLQREPIENRLLIACTEAEVQSMTAHLKQAGHSTSQWAGSSSSWPSFDDWMSVNGSKAEIMAGQHRVEALKLYLRRISSSRGSAHASFEKDQSWWICDVYDRDRLPAHLSVKLRANRQGTILPDSHGQVWREIATLATADSSLFRGANAQVQDEMLRTLGLSGRVPFPIRRLMTLWKNRSWQPMVTRWCSTDIGRETFNVSLWEEMARHRIDDFWFDIFETVLESASKLRGNAPGSLKIEDWSILARGLPSRSAKEVQSIFYPDTPDDVIANLEVKGHLYRRPKFLTAFDDSKYHQIYHTILEAPTLQFPDIQTFFRTGRQLGKTMSQVMIHVGQWLNLHPTQVSERDNNKPQLWRDFIPAFHDEHGGDYSEALALHLQRQIFRAIQPRIDEFTLSSAAAASLSQLPDSQAGDAYLERFILPIWRDLLVTVHRVAGSRFQRALVRFNAQCPQSLLLLLPPPPSSRPEESLARELRDALSRVPEIQLNPALSSAQALESLVARISPVVAEWAAQHGSGGGGVGAVKVQGRGGMSFEPSKMVDVGEFEGGKVGVVRAEADHDDDCSLKCGPAAISSSVVLKCASSEGHVIESSVETCSEALQMSVMKGCRLEQKEDFEMNRSSIQKILNA